MSSRLDADRHGKAVPDGQQGSEKLSGFVQFPIELDHGMVSELAWVQNSFIPKGVIGGEETAGLQAGGNSLEYGWVAFFVHVVENKVELS
jgi:hypothetical protein